MKGFSGDDIMLGQGSFTKFNGRLGFDWASYETSDHGVERRHERGASSSPAKGAGGDAIRDFFIETEGASGSAFDDFILGNNDTKLLIRQGRARQRQPDHRPCRLLPGRPVAF